METQNALYIQTWILLVVGLTHSRWNMNTPSSISGRAPLEGFINWHGGLVTSRIIVPLGSPTRWNWRDTDAKASKSAYLRVSSLGVSNSKRRFIIALFPPTERRRLINLIPVPIYIQKRGEFLSAHSQIFDSRPKSNSCQFSFWFGKRCLKRDWSLFWTPVKRLETKKAYRPTHGVNKYFSTYAESV